MGPILVFVFIVLVLAGVLLVMSLASSRLLRSRAERFRALGTVVEVRRCRVPGLRRAVVEYSGRGRARYVAATRPLPTSRVPRVGAKRYVEVCRVRSGRETRYWVELDVRKRP